MRKLFLILLFILSFQLVKSETPITSQLTIKGRVVDKKTGDPLVGVVITDDKSAKTYTDLNGNFEIIIKNDNHIVVSYISYNSSLIEISNDVDLNIELLEK